MKLPKSWAEITIGQYHKIITIFNLYKDDIVERELKLLVLLSGKNDEYIESLKISEISEYCKSFSFMNELPSSTKIYARFKLHGKIYKPVLITKNMLAGQFIDFSHAGKDCSPEELPYHMHELIACMCVMKKGFLFPKWEYIGYDEMADDFINLPMSIAYPYYVFFCEVLKKLQEPILEYSRNQIKMNLKKIEKILPSV